MRDIDIRARAVGRTGGILDSSAARAAWGDDILIAAIATARASSGTPLQVGLSGLQGSGKSTLAARLARRLNDDGIRTVAVSLDDFYLTKAQRMELASTAHPLLATRGVPGTHDLPLMQDLFDRLIHARAGDRVPIPHFAKSDDDRAPQAEWHVHEGPVDVILLEGWCVGARPQSASALQIPVNDLERLEDPDARWRSFVNHALATDYAQLHASLDLTILLRPPSFEAVYAWRAQQEAALHAEARAGFVPMDAAALARFVAHYERISRSIIVEAPGDLIVDIDAERRPFNWSLAMRKCPPAHDRLAPDTAHHRQI
jgi:D-glycerate 3-kinase